MKRIVCDRCGSINLVREEYSFVCKDCGAKYSISEAGKLLMEPNDGRIIAKKNAFKIRVKMK